MPQFQFYKIIGQVVCVEKDDDGTIIGEKVIATANIFEPDLVDLADVISKTVREINGYD